MRTLSSEAVSKVGKKVEVRGWVRLKRSHGKLIFLDLRDREGIIQLVVNPKTSQETHSLASELRPEDVIEATGTVKKRPAGTINKEIKTGTIEVEVASIKLVSKAETLPLDMGVEDLNLELPTLLDHRTLTLRHPRQQAIFKIQSSILEGFRESAKKLGCTEIVIPTIVASSTEGGTEVFNVDYYSHKAYLAQSPQLYKQMMVPVFERVFTISHAYRAEPSVTTRHLAEITQIDCEIGFTDFSELLDILEKVAKEMLGSAQESNKDLFRKYGFELANFPKTPRLTLREAQEIIFKEFGRDNRKEKDLTPQDEEDIGKWAKEKHGSDLVTITNYPTKAKAFYTMPDPKDPEYSLSYDLLLKGSEILSGSQRINNYKDLVDVIKERGMNPSNFSMYLSAFKFGMPPEGGFSFGLEKTTMKLLGLANIREASLFPRDMERVDERFSKAEAKK